MTETAKMADIVLPATMFLEHDDIYQASGHTRIQIARKLFEPYAECRTNHFVICETGQAARCARPSGLRDDRVAADRRSAGALWLAGCAEAVDAAGGWDALPDYETAHHLNGFPTPSGRFQFKPDWSKLGPDHARMPRLPDHFAIIDEVDDAASLPPGRGAGAQLPQHQLHRDPDLQQKEDRPTVLLHPDDGARLGVGDGDRVRLGNRFGSVVLHAELKEGQQPGVLVVESIWPNEAFEEGIGINALISAEPAPPNGGAVFHDTAVWLQPAPVAPRSTHVDQAAEPVLA